MINLLLNELNRRLAPVRIYESLFAEQQQVIDASSRFIGILTPRRAAKSWTICALMIMCCLKKKAARCLYLGLTRTSVKRIAWDIICRICDEHNIAYKANKVDLIIYIDDSSIELGGADGPKDYTERYLGAQYDVVAIDEAGSFNPKVLDYLIDTVISPTLIDKRGILLLAGTPRPIETGRYYEVTTEFPDRWQVFSWDTSKNPHMKRQWELEIQELIKENPNITKEAWFIREFLGKWCKDASDLVYKYDERINNITELPKCSFQYVLGMDIGWNDPCAFVVGAYTKKDDNLYIVEDYKKSEMYIDDIASKLEYFLNKYPSLIIVADGQNKTVIQEIRKRHSIPIIAAKKEDKQAWIEIVNTEFLIGKIKILNSCNGLIEELKHLPWDYKKDGTRKEHDAFDNHESDSLLYLARYCYNYKNVIERKLTEEEKMFNHQRSLVQKRLESPRWRNY